MKTTITLEECRSYASEANLMKGIAKFGIEHIRHVVARTPDGRWTAIFLVTEILNREGGYVGMASQYGFMSV